MVYSSIKSKRVRYFLLHLTLCIVVAIICILWMFNIWYPMPLNKAVGVTHIFLMMITIDIIVGPLLSLLVYKEHKKTLKMDLTIISICQIIALCYAMYSITQGRPVWLVYNVDRFELIRANELYTKNISKAQPEYQKVGWLRPKFVATAFARDVKELNDNMLEESLAGISLAQRPERYVPLLNATDAIKKRTKPLSELNHYNEKNKVQAIITKYPKADGFLPLKANVEDMTVLIDRKTGEVVKIVDLRPWK